MKKLVALAMAASAIAVAAPANAELLHFVITSTDPSFPDEFADFYLDSNPTPDYAIDGIGFIIYGVEGTFTYGDFTTDVDDVIFYNDDFGGGVVTFSYAITAAGPQLYTGTESDPTFLTGTFDLVDFFTGQPLSITISAVGDPTPAVPEPASWAMMIAGFGLVGGSLRAAKRRTSVTFA
jgi:hypothetical protein